MVDILSPLTVDGKVRSKDVSTLDSTDSDDTLTPKGYVDSVSESKLDRAGGLLTGPLTVEGGANINTSGHIEGTMLRTTADTHLAMVPSKYAVIDSSGWVCHRTLDETKSDLGITGKQDKLEAGMNITIDGNMISAKGTTYEVATETSDGLMSSMDKSQLIALDSAISDHVNDTTNPHNVTKSQIGLGDVDNTSDLYKPISIAVQEALNLKADKSEISRIYRPCGSVAKYNDLPSDAQIGDVYDVAETGMNYAWVEIGGVAKWDSLGMLSDKIDMTNYYTKGQVDSTVSGLQNDINTKSTVSVTRSLTSGTKIGTITINGTGTDFYCQTNTDTKVTQNNDTSTNANLPILVSATADSTTARTGTVKYVNGKAYINPSTGLLTATKFKGPLEGNVTGNCSGSSGSCTGNSATATKATQDASGNVITTTYATKNEVTNGLATKQPTLTAGNNISIVDNVISAVDTKYAVATQSANGLMSLDDKKKLDGIATGANKTTVDSALSSTSTNPVQNKVINSALASKAGTSVATTSANGLMSSTDKSKLDGIAAGANKTTVDAALSNTSTNPVQNKVVYAELNKKLAADGTAVKSTADANGNNIVDTYETKANAITGLSVSGRTITYTKGDGSTGTITTQDNNTDTKVRQRLQTGNYNLPLLLSYQVNTNTTADIDNVCYRNNSIYANPSTGTLVATKFKGPLEGNVTGNSDTATKATQDANGNNIVDTYETKANAITGLSVSGRTITYTKGNGSTGTITTQDNNTDTKNTAGSTDTSSKIFLIGATSQAANPQTYSHDTAYVGTDGKLYSGGKVVIASGDKATSAGSADSATRATALNVSSTSSIAITAGVQFISTTILSQTGNWFIETHVSGKNIFQRATSMADPSNVCVRTSSNSGSSWNGWVFSYAVWK